MDHLDRQDNLSGGEQRADQNAPLQKGPAAPEGEGKSERPFSAPFLKQPGKSENIASGSAEDRPSSTEPSTELDQSPEGVSADELAADEAHEEGEKPSPPSGRAKYEKPGNRLSGVAQELYFWGQALVISLVVLVIINVFFIRLSGVHGSSMYPTLSERDQLLVQIIGYDAPEHGDVIVVKSDYYEDEPLVKRVIGLGGDVVDINRLTGAVSVNGEELVEPYINATINNPGLQPYPFTVPEGHVFVMGDNRNASSDSRDTKVGPLPYEQIIGKVLFKIWPITKAGAVR